MLLAHAGILADRAKTGAAGRTKKRTRRNAPRGGERSLLPGAKLRKGIGAVALIFLIILKGRAVVKELPEALMSVRYWSSPGFEDICTER